MFNPRYTITNRLLDNIKRIVAKVTELNRKHLSGPVLVELIKQAEAVSAHASTSIEGNPLPLTDVKRILKNRPQHIRQSEQEVINYNTILKKINRKLEKGSIPITSGLILSIQRQITDKLLPPFRSGELRREPVFVNDPRSGKTIYWPPDHDDVPVLLQDLVDFVHRNMGVIDALILAGLFHKQMVIIHPFMDGNGRTTRLVTKILLATMGLDTFSLFSFENYYNRSVARYFEMVGIRGNYYDMTASIDFTPWLEYFTDGILDELLRVEKTMSRSLVDPRAELLPHQRKLMAIITQKGYAADRDYVKVTDRAKPTRRLDFNKLIKLGLIVRKGKGKNTYYVLKT